VSTVLEIDPRSRTERELTNRISQLVELFKCDWSIHSLCEISKRFLTSLTQDLSEFLTQMPPRVRSRRRYLRYLAQMAVHENTDSTNKRNYDVTLGSVLCHNFALSALFYGERFASFVNTQNAVLLLMQPIGLRIAYDGARARME